MPHIISTHISALYFCLILAISLVGCNRGDSHASALMDRAESLMEQRPDSALSTLDSIAPSSLTTREQSARYALLRSMALDKNYIDTTDFSVLQPALDYYLTKGNPDQKLRTYYYQGRIYQNAGDDDSAMQAFVNALDFKEKATDTLTLARTMAAQAIILKSVYDFDLYIKRRLESADLYGKVGYDKYRADCLIYALNGSLLADKRQLADSLMQLCTVEYEKGYISEESLISQRLLYLTYYGTKDQLKEFLQSVSLHPEMTEDYILKIIDSYHTLGNHDYAKSLLAQISVPENPDEKMKYYAVSATINDSLHNYKDALEDYRTFLGLVSEEHYNMFEQKLRSSEQRHSRELAVQKEANAKNNLIWSLVGSAVFLAMGIIILVIVVRKNRIKKQLAVQREQYALLENEKLKGESERLSLENKNLILQNEKRQLEAENLRHHVTELEHERDRLCLLLDSSELPSGVNEAVRIRVEMLNGIIAGYITSNEKFEKNYETWVSELVSNKDAFMNSTRLAFKASHPEAINFFEQYGLTEDEINYVCLYAIGLNGKEVGEYIQRKSHIHISSAIRKKLGIDKHETNLRIFVQRIFRI